MALPVVLFFPRTIAVVLAAGRTMMMADSLSLGGAFPLVWISACWLSFQLSLDIINVPLTSRNSRIGSANTVGTPNCVKVGPSARTMILTMPFPEMTTPNHYVLTSANKTTRTNISYGGIDLLINIVDSTRLTPVVLFLPRTTAV